MTARAASTLDAGELRRKYPFAKLVQPRVGLIDRVSFLSQDLESPVFEVAATSLGNLTMTFPHVRPSEKADVRDEMIGGAGGDIDAEIAWVRSVAEAAERYSSMVFTDDDFVVASANEIGASALDLSTIPRCSESELSDPLCPLRLPDPSLPIRWMRGISLMTQEEKLIPAILVYLYLRPSPEERFWLGISTGVAAHTNPVSAMLSAICEVIERDAIALTWLGRLPLARIESGDEVGEAAREFRDRLSRSRVQQTFFDATTDIGVPTIFSVQLTEGHPRCQLYLSCATAMDATAAYVKAIREAAPSRTVMDVERERPTNIADFRHLTHGADYYGRGGHNEDFDFLLKNDRRTTLNGVGARALCAPGATEEQQLRAIVGRLAELGMDAYVVDLTTDEVRDAGLWVVRVVVPQLLPISFVHRARYLGTPRLYTYTGRTEAEINPCPMPFA
jgi:ribosomal protein S12 methylthiotransferase accessory factor